MIQFTKLPGKCSWDLDTIVGIIPEFLDERDPRPAAEQIDSGYAHGGGWSPMPKWKLLRSGRIYYPGDPAYQPLASATLRDETILVYQSGITAIIQKNGKFEVARLD